MIIIVNNVQQMSRRQPELSPSICIINSTAIVERKQKQKQQFLLLPQLRSKSVSMPIDKFGLLFRNMEHKVNADKICLTGRYQTNYNITKINNQSPNNISHIYQRISPARHQPPKSTLRVQINSKQLHRSKYVVSLDQLQRQRQLQNNKNSTIDSSHMLVRVQRKKILSEYSTVDLWKQKHSINPKADHNQLQQKHKIIVKNKIKFRSVNDIVPAIINNSQSNSQLLQQKPIASTFRYHQDRQNSQSSSTVNIHNNQIGRSSGEINRSKKKKKLKNKIKEQFPEQVVVHRIDEYKKLRHDQKLATILKFQVKDKERDMDVEKQIRKSPIPQLSIQRQRQKQKSKKKEKQNESKFEQIHPQKWDVDNNQLLEQQYNF